MDMINVKERDADFQRQMQQLVAMAKATGMDQKRFNELRAALFERCYGDVDKDQWPSQFD